MILAGVHIQREERHGRDGRAYMERRRDEKRR